MSHKGSRCPHCGGDIRYDATGAYCFVCGWEFISTVTSKISINWPPLANENGERHTRPILDVAGGVGGDDD